MSRLLLLLTTFIFGTERTSSSVFNILKRAANRSSSKSSGLLAALKH